MSVYVLVNSFANLQYFPGNKPYHFKCKLNKVLYLIGNWEVCVSEICFKEATPSSIRGILDVYCNICGESVINGVFEPLLRRVYSEQNSNHIVFTPVYYLPVIKSEISEIEFSIKTVDRHFTNTLTSSTEIVLHLKSNDR